MQSMPVVDLLDLFPAPEGEILYYYGKIGQGKTYGATADVIRDLERGVSVYVNWQMNWNGYDERNSFFLSLLGVLGLKKKFFRFDKSNLHFIDVDESFMSNFEKLTDCSVYLDEGHVVLDSYQHAKMSMRDRKAILSTRHFNRSIVIISQRPTAVHVSARANVNRFYKFERPFQGLQKLLGITLFVRSEYQDMADETVDESKTPDSVKWYFASKKIFSSYNSKYLRAGVPRSQEVNFEGFKPTYVERVRLFLHNIPIPRLK